MHSESSELRGRAAWLLILAASVVMLITTGTRLSMGLFVSPMNTSTGLGVVAISFAMAVAQFVWGLAQPVFGAVADRYGPGRVIVTGGLMLAAGTALTPFVDSQWGLIFAMGLLSAAGAGAGSFSTLMGATAQRLTPRMRAHASGVVNAGGSAGQLLFAQLAQAIIGAAGWVAAMLTMAAAALLTLPLAWPLQAGARDIGLLAGLGLFQLAIPCALSVVCARVLKAPEVSLLALLEIVFGILLAWVGANEVPQSSVLTGGALVLGALVANEWLGWRNKRV